MHNRVDLEAQIQHREEMVRQVLTDRLGRQQPARQSKNLVATLAGLLGRRAADAAQAAR